MTSEYDVVIIGAGPGGYTAAIAAARAGMKTAVVEKSPYLGGTCLNTGCIPTKTMLAAADIISRFDAAKLYGVTFNPPGIDWAALRHRSRDVILKLRKGIQNLFRSNGVEVFQGSAEIKDPNTISVLAEEPVTLQTRYIIIATGSKSSLPRPWHGSGCVLTSSDIFELEALPEAIAIIGGGYIGCEFAYMLNAFGTQVSIIEIAPRLLPMMDSDQSKFIEKSFSASGIRIHLNQQVTKINKSGEVCEITLADGETCVAGHVLVAVGRKASVDQLGLARIGGEQTDKGFIKVNDRYQTTISNIFCIGDANGRSMLAHAAAQQAEAVVGFLMNQNHATPEAAVPWCVFTHPELASVGLTTDEAMGHGLDIAVGNVPMAALGMAHALGEAEGFIKVIRDNRTGKIIGVHLAGRGATEIINMAGPWIGKTLSEIEWNRLIFSHPSISEGLKIALEDTFAGALHLPFKKSQAIPGIQVLPS